MTRALAVICLAAFFPFSAAAEETALENVEVRSDGITIQTTLPAVYKKSRAVDPERLILEFAGVRCVKCPRTWPGQGPWLRGVRAGQFKEDPPVTRVVLDLVDGAPAYDSYEGNQVRVRLGHGTAPAAKASEKTASQAPPAKAPVAAPEQAAAPAADEPDDEPRSPAMRWLQLGGSGLALIALCLAFYRIRWLMSNLSAVRAQGGQEALRVEKKVDRELVTLIRRLSALEAKVAELRENAGAGSGAGVDPEELKQFRAVVKSLSESVRFPRN